MKRLLATATLLAATGIASAQPTFNPETYPFSYDAAATTQAEAPKQKSRADVLAELRDARRAGESRNAETYPRDVALLNVNRINAPSEFIRVS